MISIDLNDNKGEACLTLAQYPFNYITIVLDIICAHCVSAFQLLNYLS